MFCKYVSKVQLYLKIGKLFDILSQHHKGDTTQQCGHLNGNVGHLVLVAMPIHT